ncbi:MAG: hypothetical protein LWX07_05170 [Bacteroidetes bacterium]|nr:hypothetical protein [Bacteroidota bacterium]
MKRLIYIFAFITAAVLFSGCDSLWNVNYHYVTFSNTDQYKYITSVYYKTTFESRWSKDQTDSDIYPGEKMSLLLSEGTYDFEIIMEDEDYSYTFYQENISVYSDTYLDVCYDCFKDSKTKVEIKPKVKNL